MSTVRSSGTVPESLIANYLFRLGFRYRKNVPSLPGSPDIVLSRFGTVILVNGCFWHGHNCAKGRLPKTRVAFWRNKVETNKARDRRNIRKLRADGWKVIVIWQCQISNQAKRAKRLPKLVEQIKANLKD